jgi:phosphoglycolate phosphatase/pyrophosphatase PpaX
MQIKGIIFDLDGTLTDTLGLYMQGFRQAVEPLTGKHYTDAEITATLGPSEEGIIQALLPDSHEQALTAYLSAYSRLLASCRGLYQDVEALLAELRASGMLLGLVTGKGPGSTALTLAHYGLTDFFSEIATGSPEGAFKALRIEEIRTRWGLTAQEVLYVGDAPSDIQPAKAAGVNMAVAA